MDRTDIGVKEQVTAPEAAPASCRESPFGLYSGVLGQRSKIIMNKQLTQRKPALSRPASRQGRSPGARYFSFLKRLRASGRSNMYGAIPYLMRAFGLDREAAFRVVCEWEDVQAAERAEAAEPAQRR